MLIWGQGDSVSSNFVKFFLRASLMFIHINNKFVVESYVLTEYSLHFLCFFVIIFAHAHNHSRFGLTVKLCRAHCEMTGPKFLKRLS